MIFTSQIYDPSATTTKPPERRESVLPRNLIQNKSRIQIEPRSLKWQQQARDNVSPKSDTKNWSSWRKASGSEIEQRTQIDIENYGPHQVPEQIPEQQHNLEFDNLEQRENLKPPVEYRDLINFDKNYGHFENESKYGNRPHNEIDFQHKYPQRNEGTKEINVGFQNEDYEGVAIDSTVTFKIFKQIRFYKENIYISMCFVSVYSKNLSLLVLLTISLSEYMINFDSIFVIDYSFISLTNIKVQRHTIRSFKHTKS